VDKNLAKVIIYLMVCVLVGSVISETTQILFLRNKNADIKEEIRNKKNHNRLLKAELLLLENDTRYISILARKNLGMIRHGEKIYKFSN
jgi:cell division protein FtsL